MITRKIGMIVRGDSTPFQLMAACVLGAMLGFMPAFGPAAGSIVFLTLLLIIINANLKLAGLVLIAAKLLSLLFLPLTFRVGQWLLDGPFQGLFQWLVNAPVAALFGFEYYATTGGWAVGLCVGLIAGAAVVRGITRFRTTMMSLESGSPRFQEFASRKWVKVVGFVFAGGHAKQSYEELLRKRIGNPVRPAGIVFAGLTLLLLGILYAFASGPIIAMAIQSGLERVNGATVDLAEADVNLRDGRLAMIGLAMADPNNLETDLFRAARIEADINGADLLRKRLHLDRVVVSGATQGETRVTPGHRTGKPPVESEDAGVDWPDSGTLEDYLRTARVWKERLAQARRWLEKISGPESSDEPGTDGGVPGETWRERLEREAREKGYARVRADHLIANSPTLTVTELIAEKVRVTRLPDETVDVIAENLSTHPRLSNKTPRIVIRSSADTLGMEFAAGALDAGRSDNTLNFHYRGLPTDSVASQLKVGGSAPVSGGTMDIRLRGTVRGGSGAFVDFPLQVTLHNATFVLPQMKPQQVGQFTLPIAVRGPLANPRIQVDDKQLADALVKAGISRATSELVDKAGEKIGGALGERGGEARTLIEGIIKRPER